MGKFYAGIERELNLHVRHLAWLHATPKPPAGSKRAKKADPARAVSRMEAHRQRKVIPPMPPLTEPLILHRLLEVGLSEAGGMGPVPLSWREIAAAQENGIALVPWEARLFRRLSLAYLAEGRKSEDETCPPPWSGKVTKREIEAEEAGLRSLLG